MANHITVGRHNLQRQFVPHPPAGPVTSALTYIVHQSQHISLAAPAKKETPSELWDLQTSSLYRLVNVPNPEYPPDIWQTLVPLTKKGTTRL